MESNRSSYKLRNELKQDLTLDQIRRRSSSIFADLRYLFALNCTSSIASFKPGSIVLTIFADPWIAFIDLRCSFHRSTLYRWNSHAFRIPALSVDLRLLVGFPALSSIVGISISRIFLDLRDQASISRVFNLPRFSRWRYIIIEFFYVTRLDL